MNISMIPLTNWICFAPTRKNLEPWNYSCLKPDYTWGRTNVYGKYGFRNIASYGSHNGRIHFQGITDTAIADRFDNLPFFNRFLLI